MLASKLLEDFRKVGIEYTVTSEFLRERNKVPSSVKNNLREVYEIVESIYNDLRRLKESKKI